MYIMDNFKYNSPLIGNKPDTTTVAIKNDTDKPALELIPPEAIFALGEVLSYGKHKYGERNWENGFKWGRLFGAIMRHLWAFWQGEDVDKESKLPHLYHALAGIVFLTIHYQRKIGEDNRKK